jgi:gluconolactonase
MNRTLNSWKFTLSIGLITLLTQDINAEEAKTKKVKLQDIQLEVPVSWKQQQPTSRLRAGQFQLPAVAGDKDAAELVVYFFGGAGGGVDANLKRWIGQFAAQGRKVTMSSGKSAQGPYYLAEVTGTYNKPIGPPIRQQTKATPGSKMVAVILLVKEKGNYFLKLTGPDKTVSAATAPLRKGFGADKAAEKAYSLEK